MSKFSTQRLEGRRRRVDGLRRMQQVASMPTSNCSRRVVVGPLGPLAPKLPFQTQKPRVRLPQNMHAHTQNALAACPMMHAHAGARRRRPLYTPGSQLLVVFTARTTTLIVDSKVPRQYRSTDTGGLQLSL